MSLLETLFGGAKKDPLHGAPIEDYAMIGDLETGALVCRNGSLDWLCWPTFSDGAVFAGLLGTGENGFFSLRPAKDEAVTGQSWRYLPQTLIVEKTWQTLDGEVQVLDFMPIRDRNSDVVRIVRGVRGTVKMRMELQLRFDYGRTTPWVTTEERHLRAVAGPHKVVLRTDADLHGEEMCTASDFVVNEGETASFILSYGASLEEDPEAFQAEGALRDTEKFWCDWVAQSSFDGNKQYHAAVERSLLMLKAMTYRPSGGMVAALTAGLPEKIGGERNWDYRYCWIRDAAFTILVLLHAGFQAEAMQWRGWLLRAIAGTPEQFRAVYGIQGEQLMVEYDLPWLRGYEDSKPVRIGNAAVDQLQLDNYGDLISALTQIHTSKDDMWNKDIRAMVMGLLEHLSHIWHEPDNGIWEERGKRKHFVHSKLMAWMAFHRAILSYEKHHDPSNDPDNEKHEAMLASWKRNRDEIRAEILDKGYDKERNTFVQSYGSDRLDASLLRIPLVGFLPGDDPRVVGTVDAIGKELMKDGLILRYNTAGGTDGLKGDESPFLACNFWYAAALHCVGRCNEAEAFFEKLLGLRNDLGLLAEEYDSVHKRQLGNFPQALSHLALCHAAMVLEGVPGAWNGHSEVA